VQWRGAVTAFVPATRDFEPRVFLSIAGRELRLDYEVCNSQIVSVVGSMTPTLQVNIRGAFASQLIVALLCLLGISL
jgi:hypothetical protein